jgi:hypothetical protein
VKGKVIYLDQFVVRKCFCPDATEPHMAFYAQVAELCMDLALKRIAIFPFSESHLRETASVGDLSQRAVLTENFQRLSSGRQFIQRSGILIKQATELWKQSPPDWSSDGVLFKHGLKFGDQLESTQGPARAEQHELLRHVLTRWGSLPKSEVSGIAQTEAATYARMCRRDLARGFPATNDETIALLGAAHNQLLSELFWLATEDGLEDPSGCALAFLQDRAIDVPSIHLESELWASFAKGRRPEDLPRASDPANTAEDIHFVSAFIPYCDAAFIDEGMRTLVTQSKLFKHLKPRVFSISNKDAFIAYLSSLRDSDGRS